MKLRFVERLFTLFPNKTEVEDEYRNLRYTIIRCTTGFGIRLKLLDISENEIAAIRQKLILFSIQFLLTRNGEDMVVRPLSDKQDNYYFGMATHGWRTFGNLIHGTYAIMSDGQTVAEIQKTPHPDGHLCEITYHNPGYEEDILAFVLAIESAMYVR